MGKPLNPFFGREFGKQRHTPTIVRAKRIQNRIVSLLQIATNDRDEKYEKKNPAIRDTVRVRHYPDPSPPKAIVQQPLPRWRGCPYCGEPVRGKNASKRHCATVLVYGWWFSSMDDAPWEKNR